jgi:CorA-like Mg2+ transporter protein
VFWKDRNDYERQVRGGDNIAIAKAVKAPAAGNKKMQQLIRFQRIIGPMTEVCSRLVHLETPCLDANARPYFQDVLDHVRRVEVMVNSLRDVLTLVFEVSNLLEQRHQVVIARQLAAWAAILAVPTAIAAGASNNCCRSDTCAVFELGKGFHEAGN